MSELAIDSSRDKLPSGVREELSDMPPEKQQEFLRVYRKRTKSVVVAYLLWILYGMHYVYLDSVEIGVWYWLTAGGLVVWMIVDLFRIPRLVRSHNMHAAIIAMADVRSGSA